MTTTSFVDTACVTPGPEARCAEPGWRSLAFAEMEDEAFPDAEPVPASVDGQPLSVINFGLQYDETCHRWGRWAVVPEGLEAKLFD